MIDVAFTRQETRAAGVSVVIDVLRATTTIVRALELGYDQVVCADAIDRARGLAGPGCVLAGEVRCVRPPGFALGNSPRSLTPVDGGQLVLATTNGAPAIVSAAAGGRTVMLGSVRNLAAVVAAIDTDDVQVVCAGTDGAPSVEDSYVAGRIVDALGGPLADSALIARAVARAYPEPRAALAAGAGATALRAAGLAADIDWCARESITDVVPRVIGSCGGTATLVDGIHRLESRSGARDSTG